MKAKSKLTGAECPLSAVNDNEAWCHRCGAIVSRPLNQIVLPDESLAAKMQGLGGRAPSIFCEIVDHAPIFEVDELHGEDS